jgi:apolipoprotein N-acyltransferase
MRARELARPIARATNTGRTAIIDHQGRITAQVAPFEVVTLRGRVTPQRGLTPFARFGEAPVIVLSALLCLMAWRQSRRPAQTPPTARRLRA